MLMFTFLQSYVATKTERGAGLAEYALLLVLIAVACVIAITALGTEISNVFDDITAELN